MAAYRASDPHSPVVCLAGTDAAYAELGRRGARRPCGRPGATYVILAGKPGDRTVATSAVDDACATGVDALAFLRRVREELTSEERGQT